MSRDGNHVEHGAAPNLPEVYVKAVDGSVIGPRAGSCGTAMYTRQAVVVTDMLTDPLWADYRDLAKISGLRSCWSTPILSSLCPWRMLMDRPTGLARGAQGACRKSDLAFLRRRRVERDRSDRPSQMAKIFNRACQYCSGARASFRLELAATLPMQGAKSGTASSETNRHRKKPPLQALKYSPETIEIRKGETVEWINNDLAPHTVTSQAADTFNSGAIDPDSSWSHTFSQPGTFPYYCTFHPEMKATVNVK